MRYRSKDIFDNYKLIFAGFMIADNIILLNPEKSIHSGIHWEGNWHMFSMDVL